MIILACDWIKIWTPNKVLSNILCHTYFSLKIKIKFLFWRNVCNLIYVYEKASYIYLLVSLYFLYIASDLGLFSSVSRFTFEEYEGNSAAAVGLKGMFTILFPKCFMLFVFHPKWIVFRQGCHIQSTWFSSQLVFTNFFHKFFPRIFSLHFAFDWEILVKFVEKIGENMWGADC